MNTKIKIENLNKSFGKNEVIRNASLEIFESEFLCLLGPSGCGKSTFLRLLIGLEKPDSGKILKTEPISNALVFQNFALFPWLTVSENIAFGLRMKQSPSGDIDKKVKTIIEEMGLAGSENLHPKELSGGMKQRVGLGRALAMEPNVLFLDEPFGSLDAQIAEELRKILLDIWQRRKITIVMVTHLIEEAIFLGDRIVLLASELTKNSIEEIFINPLSRPRNLRSTEAYSAIDYLKEKIKD